MLRRLDNRVGHYALLVLLWAGLCLPNLGGPSLWDIDEGNNAECAAEMYHSGNWIVPTFNGKLRVDKPVLLYWLQTAAYHVYGVTEFAARLPSALASLLALLIAYELGRNLFSRAIALLAALVLATSVAFCVAAHFANPDALLNLSILLSLWCFWNHCQRGAWWLMGAGAACGVGMLAKGPVALVLPMAVTLLFLLLRRELRRLWDVRLLGAAAMFVLIAAPWYVWVGVETKGEWLSGFFWKHNVERTLGVLENHSGPFYYYALVLIVGLTPWSVFLGPTIVSALRSLSLRQERTNETSGKQFLLCWSVVWLVFFTVVRTKLPNYILPIYPAMALLTASFLDDWRRGNRALPAWVMPTSIVCLALVGVGVGLGLLIVGDAVHLTLVARRLPALASGAWLGIVFIAAATLAAWHLRQGRRAGLIHCVTASGIVFTGLLGLWGVNLVDRYKAPRTLVQALPEDQLYREVRVGALGYFQPSLVFYCQREVQCPDNMIQAIELLHTPLPTYLFVGKETWEQMRIFAPSSYRLLAQQRDLYNGREVLLMTNEPLN